MNFRSRKAFTFVALLVSAVVIYAFAKPTYRQGEPSVAGRRPDNFALTLNGQPAHLADLHGKVVVLNFWASWCQPCVEEIGSLNALQQKIAARGGTILGVSIDEDEGAYEKFLRDHHVPFPNFRDPSKKIASSFGTSMWPETYIIGTDGRIARKIIGPQKWDAAELSGYIESLLPGN
ncbi:MAG TPA: TlpA disulfide reductase family protein [Candidatus Acidoferrales bacterium]|nr:TlpA disulfide reductase family protein [Candidatus Acidoferrales bacterium]